MAIFHENYNKLLEKFTIEIAIEKAKNGSMLYANEMLKHNSKNCDLVLDAL